MDFKSSSVDAKVGINKLEGHKNPIKKQLLFQDDNK